MSDRRRLIVMRHAKAEPFGASDHARPLTDRGRTAARDVGAHLADIDLVPEHALVSSAERTRATWAEVAAASGATCEASFDDLLFSGGVDDVLEAVRGVPIETGTLVFVGHNPIAAYLAHFLDDGEGDPAAVTGLLRGFPPGAAVVLEIDVPWAELGPETGRVVDFYIGA